MADCIGRTIRFCSKDTENCGSYFSPFYFISLQILINWILLNSFIAIVVDSFIMLLQEQDEISRIELVKESFSDSWNKYDTQRKGFLSFKKFVDMYNDIEIPENFEWGSKKIKFFKTKPHISYLFKNLKVYYNYCTFTDALFCITSFWVNDDLPMNVRNALWEHNGWNKIIRKKLVIKGNTISISGQDCGIPIKEISFGAVYGIYLLQRQYKKWKSCDDLEVAYKNNITNKEEGKINIRDNENRSIKSIRIYEDDIVNNKNDNNSDDDDNNKNENDNNDNDIVGDDANKIQTTENIENDDKSVRSTNEKKNENEKLNSNKKIRFKVLTV